MAIKFEKIQAGMKLYDRQRRRIGNTTMTGIMEWPVYVVSVNAERRSAVVKWNGNGEQSWTEYDLRGLYDWSMSSPVAETVKGMLGQVIKVRKLSKKELAAKSVAKPDATP